MKRSAPVVSRAKTPPAVANAPNGRLKVALPARFPQDARTLVAGRLAAEDNVLTTQGILPGRFLVFGNSPQHAGFWEQPVGPREFRVAAVLLAILAYAVTYWSIRTGQGRVGT
jgi:hypothetical protein